MKTEVLSHGPRAKQPGAEQYHGYLAMQRLLITVARTFAKSTGIFLTSGSSAAAAASRRLSRKARLLEYGIFENAEPNVRTQRRTDDGEAIAGL